MKPNEIAQLQAFALEILKAWPHGGVDGFDLQDIAEKHGLLIPVRRTEPCGESCACYEMYGAEEFKGGLPCYRHAEWLAA
jgi:hypothetical protein